MSRIGTSAMRAGLLTLLLGPNVVNAQQPTAEEIDQLVLEEIIVTSQKRVESLQDVPISVNAVSGEKLMEAGIEKIEDIALYVPNLSMSETGIGTNVYVRGIGSGINNGFEQSVGMYVDGIYYGRAQLARAPFLDLERVEVLRGPQGILFGKNSIAGAISMITARPTDEFEASVSGLYEPDLEEIEGTLIVSGPFTDRLRGRLAYQYREIDGHMKNLITDNYEPEREEQSIRGTLAWDVTDNFDITLKAEFGNFDVKGRQVEIVSDEIIPPASELLRPGSLAATFEGQSYSQILNSFGEPAEILNTQFDFKRTGDGGDFSNNDTTNVTLTANWALGEHTLTSVTGYLTYEFEENCDCDFTGANVFNVIAEEDFDQFSQEIRLTSPVGGRVEYIAGVFYQTNELDFTDAFVLDAVSVLEDVIGATAFSGLAPAATNLNVPRVYFQDTDAWALFAQATLNVTDSLRLTVGGRFTDEEKDGARSLTWTDPAGNEFTGTDLVVRDILLAALFRAGRHDESGSRSESKFTPSVNIQWDVVDDAMLYFTWSQGFKSGGFDARSNTAQMPSGTGGFLPAGSFEFEDEEADSFEVGVKTTLFGGRAELNAAAFYTEYSDLQVSIFDGTLGFNVGNAAEATTQGLELDGRFLLTDNLVLLYSLALIDFEFDSFPNGQCSFNEPATGFLDAMGNLTVLGPSDPFPPGATPVCDYQGRTNQYVPDVSATLTADYSTSITENLELRASVDFLYSDEYFTSQNLDPQSIQDDYWKINARLGVGAYDGKWELALVGKNLTEEEIIAYSNDTPLAVGTFSSRGRYGFSQPTRTVALTGTWRF